MYNMMKTTVVIISVLGCLGTAVLGQTIAEKKAGIVEGSSELGPELQKFLVEINKELTERRAELHRLQDTALELYRQKAPTEEFQALLFQINDAKENIRILQESWREMATRPGVDDEAYALWHQPDTTLEQLVIDYGSLDYVYLIPPEIAEIQVSVSSNIPIPHASWGEMLEQILLQNGVGIKTLNPFLRELYLLKENLSGLKLITGNPLDLEAYPDTARVSFVLTPEPLDLKRIWHFLEKFANPHTIVLQRIGRAILIVGEASEVKELLKIHDFVVANKRGLEYKAVPLYRIEAEEMAKVLKVIFEEFVEEVDVEEAGSTEKGQTTVKTGKSGKVNALEVIALPKLAQAVFLIGTKEEIAKAEEIIQQLESQVGEARDRSIFWYNVKHSDPEDLAQVLEKIYLMMIEGRYTYTEDHEKKEERDLAKKEAILEEKRAERERRRIQEEIRLFNERSPRYFEPPYYQQGEYVVNPSPIGRQEHKERLYNRGRDNFIVDPKTGSLVMVVETDLLPKLQDVIRKLDVPKKMVQIEVLLFERIMKRNQEYGLNMLKLGDAATKKNISESAWAGGLSNCLDRAAPLCTGRGIFEFFFSRKNQPFDLAYKFLMSQEDLYLNASPSVVTLNQTEASITINDERSVRIGRNITDSNTVTAQDAFQRAQYGITINVVPTIHMAEDNDLFGDSTNYITLVSRINFDTFPAGQENSDQPRVNRREIKNEVRIPDGQAVIIGGLRRKDMRDNVGRIPFLGEIPGIGKLFSATSLEDTDTEMIIFITPKIISEPKEDLAKLRFKELCKRPGDLPSFIHKLNCALDREKHQLFQGWMTMLFGRQPPRYICEEGEYDGR